MSGDEVGTRLAQEFNKRADLLRHQLGMPPEAIRLHGFSTEGKFFFHRGQAAPRAELLRQFLPTEATAVVDEADEICQHRFRLLGYENLDYGKSNDIDWHLDRVHGKRAPLDPWFKVPFLEFARVGDHKVTWELNRHQHLVTLAKAWLLTRDEKYVRELTAQWRSWINANPYPLGINWTSTLEVAFRSLSWIWVDHLLADAPEYANYRAELLPALAFHGRYIERYLSTYFSPNTHLLGEAVALFFLGTLYPQMPHATRWKSAGWQVIVREAGRQVRPDGVYFEQSLYYHVYALDFFLHARMLAAANGKRIPATYDEVLGKMLTVLAALAQTGPAEGFGDDDGGRLFNPRRNHTEHMTDPLALGALALSRNDLAAARLTEESIWLYGERALAELVPPRPQLAPASIAFRDGGLYVIADTAPCPQTMTIDAGPQGTGRCGHGHADALALRLTMNGSRWLVDSGSGVYISSNPADRTSLRGTGAHNTVRVDALDQALPQDPFSWAAIPTSHAENWIAAQTFTYFSGSHDGYARLPDPVTHRRSILRVNGFAMDRVSNVRACDDAACDGGVWLVRDVLLGAADHNLEIRWHFASDVVLCESDTKNELLASKREPNHPTLRLIFPEETVWQTKIARTLLSPAYGRYQPAPVVQSEARVKLPAEFATACLMQENASERFERARLISVPQEKAQAYELHLGDESHGFFFARDKQPWSFGPWSSDAELLYCRIEKEMLTQLIVIGGTSVEWQDRPLLQAGVPSKYFEWRKLDAILRAEPDPFAMTPLFDQLTGSPLSTASNVNPASSYAEKN
jgi:Heparinase II/III N-terminus/Heparinase II/III-like protein